MGADSALCIGYPCCLAAGHRSLKVPASGFLTLCDDAVVRVTGLPSREARSNGRVDDTSNSLPLAQQLASGANHRHLIINDC